MALMVPDEVRTLFQVLTGEEWPDANEDHLRALADAWDTAAGRLSGELAPRVQHAVVTIRTTFHGQAEQAFAARMAPFVEGQNNHLANADRQFRMMAKFLRKLALDVEYVKLVSIITLVTLIAEIAWATSMAFWTGGASMAWLAARVSIVRSMLRHLLGRLFLRLMQAAAFGVAFQLVIDVLAQGIQFGTGSRKEWDTDKTGNSAGVGALGGAISPFLSGVGKGLANGTRGGLDNWLGKVEKGRDWHKDLPEAIVDIGVEGLQETLTEALYKYITEGEFELNPYSTTSGMVSGAGNVIGNEIGLGLGGGNGPGPNTTPPPVDVVPESTGKESTGEETAGNDTPAGDGGPLPGTTDLIGGPSTGSSGPGPVPPRPDGTHGGDGPDDPPSNDDRRDVDTEPAGDGQVGVDQVAVDQVGVDLGNDNPYSTDHRDPSAPPTPDRVEGNDDVPPADSTPPRAGDTPVPVPVPVVGTPTPQPPGPDPTSLAGEGGPRGGNQPPAPTSRPGTDTPANRQGAPATTSPATTSPVDDPAAQVPTTTAPTSAEVGVPAPSATPPAGEVGVPVPPATPPADEAGSPVPAVTPSAGEVGAPVPTATPSTGEAGAPPPTATPPAEGSAPTPAPVPGPGPQSVEPAVTQPASDQALPAPAAEDASVPASPDQPVRQQPEPSTDQGDDQVSTTSNSRVDQSTPEPGAPAVVATPGTTGTQQPAPTPTTLPAATAVAPPTAEQGGSARSDGKPASVPRTADTSQPSTSQPSTSQPSTSSRNPGATARPAETPRVPRTSRGTTDRAPLPTTSSRTSVPAVTPATPVSAIPVLSAPAPASAGPERTPAPPSPTPSTAQLTPPVPALDPERGPRPPDQPEPAPHVPVGRQQRDIPMIVVTPPVDDVLPSLALPSYVQQSQALGTVAAVDLRGVERVTAAVAELLSRHASGTPKGVMEIGAVLETDFESFLGEGRPFQVRVGPHWFDVKVKATMKPPVDVDEASSTPAETTKVDMWLNSGTTTSTTKNLSTGNDIGIGATASQGVGAYGSLGVKAPLATPVTTTTTSTAAVDQRIIRAGEKSTIVQLPVQYSVALIDHRGVPVDGTTVRSDDAGEVDVVVQFADDLLNLNREHGQGRATPDDPEWGVKLEHPVPEAVTMTGADKLFEDVSARLHPSITKLGAEGRSTLRDFLSPTSIRGNLGPMLNGWVTSPNLLSPHGSRASAVKIKATLIDAELLGTHDSAQLRLHESTAMGSTVTTSTSSGVDVNAAVGGGVGAPAATVGSAGLVGGISARTAESSTSGTATTNRTGIQIKGATGLYRVNADVEIRTPHGPDLKVPATTYLRIGLPEAAAQGLPVPEGTPKGIAKPTAEPRFEPPYLASGLAVGNAKVGEFTPVNHVQAQVESLLAGLDGFEDFLPQWNGTDGVRGSTGWNGHDFAVQMSNQRLLDTELSPTALRSQMDSLLGAGVQVRLKRRGHFTNDYVNITVKAKLGPGSHLGQADARNVRGSSSAGPRLDSSTATTKGWSAGVEARAGATKPAGASVFSPIAGGGVKYSSSTSVKTAAGPTVNSTWLNTGSPDAQVFEHHVEFQVDVTVFSRTRTQGRLVTPATPVTEVPPSRTVARTVDLSGNLDPADPDTPRILPLIRGRIHLWLSDGSTLKVAPPALDPDDHRTTPLPKDTRISDLLNPAAPRPPQPEWLHVEAVVHSRELRDEAIALLDQVSGGDRALTLPGTESRNRIDRLFSPEGLKANLRRLVETGVEQNALKYSRRMTDRSGAIGVTARLGNPAVVSISDNTGTEHADTGGFKAGGSTTRTKSVELSGNVGMSAKPGATTARSNGSLTAAARWVPWLRSTSEVAEVGGGVDRNLVTPPSDRTVLVRMDVTYDIVAESRSGNVAYRGTPYALGRSLTQPGAVYLRLSEDAARGLNLLRDVPPQQPRSFGRLSGPKRLDPRGGPSALGLSLVHEVPDLSSVVSDLAEQLGENTKSLLKDKLLPDSVLDDSMDNLRRLVDFTSSTSVKSLIDSALDGGVPLLLHQPGAVMGKDTYQVTLKAYAGPPKFDRVVNDGRDIEHTILGAKRTATGKGRGTAWGAGLRTGGAGVANPSGPTSEPVTGSAGAGAGATMGRARGSTITKSATGQANNLRAGGSPAARFDVPIRFELVVERGDQVLGRARGNPENLGVRIHADSVRVNPEPRPGYGSTVENKPATAGRPDEVKAWQQSGDPVTPPSTASVEALVGAADVRRAAIEALRRAGAGAGITGKGTGSLNALLSALSSENLQPNLPDMTAAALDVPGLHEASVLPSQHAKLKVHAKFANPRLDSLSDTVNLEAPKSTVLATTHDVQHAETADFSVAVVSGGMRKQENHADGSPDPVRTPTFSTTGIEARHIGQDAESQSSGPTANVLRNLKPQGRTGLVEVDVEYRFVADLGGRTSVNDLVVKGSADLRMPLSDLENVLGRKIGGELSAAQDAVRDTAKSWRSAEVAVDNARHALQDLAQELAADVAKAEADVTAGRSNVDAATRAVRTGTDAVQRLESAADEADNQVERTSTAVENLTSDLRKAREIATRADETLRERAEDVPTRARAVDTAVADVEAAEARLRASEEAPGKADDDGRAAAEAATDVRRRALEVLREDLKTAGEAHSTALREETEARKAAKDANRAVADAENALKEAVDEHTKAREAAGAARDGLKKGLGALRGAERVHDHAGRQHRSALDTRQSLRDRITAAEQDLATARAAADEQQSRWWEAKAEVERRIAEFNAGSDAGSDADQTAPATPDTAPAHSSEPRQDDQATDPSTTRPAAPDPAAPDPAAADPAQNDSAESGAWTQERLRDEAWQARTVMALLDDRSREDHRRRARNIILFTHDFTGRSDEPQALVEDVLAVLAFDLMDADQDGDNTRTTQLSRDIAAGIGTTRTTPVLRGGSGFDPAGNPDNARRNPEQLPTGDRDGQGPARNTPDRTSPAADADQPQPRPHRRPGAGRPQAVQIDTLTDLRALAGHDASADADTIAAYAELLGLADSPRSEHPADTVRSDLDIAIAGNADYVVTVDPETGVARTADMENESLRAHSESDSRSVSSAGVDSVPGVDAARPVVVDGNLSSSNAPIVTLDYTVVTDGVVPPFTRHAEATTLTTRTGFPAVLPVVERTPVDKPVMVFSSDGTLAVPQRTEEGHFKEFYATEDRVTEGNARLGEVGSTLRLEPVPGNRIRFDGNGVGTELVMVRPTFRSQPPGVCSEFSQKIIGGVQSQAVLRPADVHAPAVLARIGEGGPHVFRGTHELAEVLANAAENPPPDGLRPETAVDAMARQNGGRTREVMPGRVYGTALRPGTEARARLDEAARRLGVNQHAWANPGEAYIAQSIAAAKPSTRVEPTPDYSLNFARPVPGSDAGEALTRVWGYHFGSVVMDSADGKSQLTLEVVRQGAARKYVLDRAIGDNLRRHGNELRKIQDELRADPDASDARKNLVQALIDLREARATLFDPRIDDPGTRQAAETARQRSEYIARQSITALAGPESLPPLGQMWFINHYSKAPGETFFDKWGHVDTPQFTMQLANPLVAVTVSHNATSSDVVSMPDARDLDVTAVADGQAVPPGEGKLRTLARDAVNAALWRHRNGLPLPEVHLHGHSKSLSHPAANSRHRADVAAAFVRREIDLMLADRQRDLPPGRSPLTGDRIRVVAESHGRGLAPGVDREQGRRGVVGEMVLPTPGTTSAPPSTAPASSTVSAPQAPSTEGGADTPVPPVDAPDTPRPPARTRDDAAPGPDPEWSFDGPAGTHLSQEQNARIDLLAAEVAETNAMRDRNGYEPAAVEVSGANARTVAAALDARGVHAEIRPDGRGTGTDVHVRWDLRRPADWTPPPAHVGDRIVNEVITSAEPQGSHPVLDEPSWRHSTAAGAPSWFDALPDAVDSTAIEAARDVPITSTVRGENGGLLKTSTITAGQVDLKAWRGLIAYDLRDLDVGGAWVRDFTVKLHLNPDGSVTDRQVADLRTRTRQGVESLFNRGNRLPRGGQFHVTVEFVTDPADAHAQIDVTPSGRPNQFTWPTDSSPGALGHEIGHFLGLHDEYFEVDGSVPVFQHQDGQGRVVDDSGPMTHRLDEPDASVKPRHLWLLENHMRALESSTIQPPSAPITPGAVPPSAPAGTARGDAPRLDPVKTVSPTFVEDLFDALDDTVETAPRPAHLRETRWDSPRPADPGPLTPERLRDEFGMPEINQRRLQKLADRFNVTYDVRPTNPDSVKWLEQGAAPKPKDIKAKTISELDTYLGASREHVGLVGYFEPTLPDDVAELDPGLRDRLVQRHRNRSREFRELAEEFRQFAAEGRYRVDPTSGTVEMSTPDGYKPITGDHDVFHIRRPDDGTPLDLADYELDVWRLTRRNTGVQHGAHMYWEPQGDFQHKIYQDIVDRHRQDAPDAEPLIRFSPGEAPTLVFADPPPPATDVPPATEAPTTPSPHGPDPAPADPAGNRPWTPDRLSDEARLARTMMGLLGGHLEGHHRGRARNIALFTHDFTGRPDLPRSVVEDVLTVLSFDLMDGDTARTTQLSRDIAAGIGTTRTAPVLRGGGEVGPEELRRGRRRRAVDAESEDGAPQDRQGPPHEPAPIGRVEPVDAWQNWDSDTDTDSGSEAEPDPDGRPVPEHEPLVDFVERMRPLMDHIQGAPDKQRRNIDVFVVADIGSLNRMDNLRGDVGHAWITVKLPKRGPEVSFGFGPSTNVRQGALTPFVRVEGQIRDEIPMGNLPRGTKVVGPYKTNAENLVKGYLYALAAMERKYNLLQYNCVSFARDFLKEVSGIKTTLHVKLPRRLIDKLPPVPAGSSTRSSSPSDGDVPTADESRSAPEDSEPSDSDSDTAPSEGTNAGRELSRRGSDSEPGPRRLVVANRASDSESDSSPESEPQSEAESESSEEVGWRGRGGLAVRNADADGVDSSSESEPGNGRIPSAYSSDSESSDDFPWRGRGELTVRNTDAESDDGLFAPDHADDGSGNQYPEDVAPIMSELDELQRTLEGGTAPVFDDLGASRVEIDGWTADTVRARAEQAWSSLRELSDTDRAILDERATNVIAQTHDVPMLSRDGSTPRWNDVLALVSWEYLRGGHETAVDFSQALAGHFDTLPSGGNPGSAGRDDADVSDAESDRSESGSDASSVAGLPNRIDSAVVPFTRHAELTTGAHEVIQDIGDSLHRELADQHATGSPYTGVRITGYGNSRTHARRTSQARAEAVRDALVNVLREQNGRQAGVRPDLERLKTEVVAAGRDPQPRSAGPTLDDRRRSAIVDLVRPELPARSDGPSAVTRSDGGTDLPRAARDFADRYGTALGGLDTLALGSDVLSDRLADLVSMADGGRLEDHTSRVLGSDDVSKALAQLDRDLRAVPDPVVREQVRTMVNDAVLAASLVPSRERAVPDNSRLRLGDVRERVVVQPITVDRLRQVLVDISVNLDRGVDPFHADGSTVEGIRFDPAESTPQRFARLGLVDLNAEGRAAVQDDALFQLLLDNPAALVDSLFGATGHDEQHFMNTCAAAAVNTVLRGKVPTTAGLLVVGRGVVERVLEELHSAPPDELAARDRTFGRTVGDMVRTRIDDANRQFDSIESRARELATANHSDPSARREWANLTKQWGRTMQKLAAVLDLKNGQPPVLTRKVIPGAWELSIPLLLPVGLDRPSRRATGMPDTAVLNASFRYLAPDPRAESTEQRWNDPRVPISRRLLDRDAVDRFWEDVQAGAGILLAEPGHAMALLATEVDGEHLFVLSDPVKSQFDYLSADQFVEWGRTRGFQTGRSVFDNPPVVVPSAPRPADGTVPDFTTPDVTEPDAEVVGTEVPDIAVPETGISDTRADAAPSPATERTYMPYRPTPGTGTQPPAFTYRPYRPGGDSSASGRETAPTYRPYRPGVATPYSPDAIAGHRHVPTPERAPTPEPAQVDVPAPAAGNERRAKRRRDEFEAESGPVTRREPRRAHPLPQRLVPPSPRETEALLEAVPPGTRFTDPSRWLSLVNGDRSALGREVNCLDAALAFDSTYRGNPRVAGAGPTDELVPGSVRAAYEETPYAPEWIGRGPEALREVIDRVTRAGHGSDAVVIGFPRGSVGHVWNVVNHHGAVSLVDAQAGTSRPATEDAIEGLDRVYAIPVDADGGFIVHAPLTAPPVEEGVGPEVVAEYERVASSPDPDWSSYLSFVDGHIHALRADVERLGPEGAATERERLAHLVLHHRDVDVHRMRLDVAAGREVVLHDLSARLVPGLGGLRLVGAVVTAELAADLAAVLGRDLVALVVGSDGEEPRELKFPPRGRPLPVAG
ncbi:toxin glutamine deamidase domain-containing protein [Saccharothrix isguenensis]